MEASGQLHVLASTPSEHGNKTSFSKKCEGLLELLNNYQPLKMTPIRGVY